MMDSKVEVPDKVVIDALLRVAKRFKSKWELNVNEPTRCKPNTRFLKRTLHHLVRTNQDRMRRPRHAASVEREIYNGTSLPSISSSSPDKKRSKPEASNEYVDGKRKSHGKSKHCSKSKHRSPVRKRKCKHRHGKSPRTKRKEASMKIQ